MTKLTSAYGVYADFTNGIKVPYEVAEGGENLAAKLVYADRIVRLTWDGVCTVETVQR